MDIFLVAFGFELISEAFVEPYKKLALDKFDLIFGKSISISLIIFLTSFLLEFLEFGHLQKVFKISFCFANNKISFSGT